MDDLGPDAIHLWVAEAARWEAPAVEAEAFAVLGPEEQARWKSRRSLEDRRLFTVSHWLMRHTLSRYDGRPPAAWRFVTNHYGKPRIDPAHGPSPLRFSLSHTRGLAACAVTQGVEPGVDVERTDRLVNAPKLIHRFFAATEAETLKALPRKELQEQFFIYWTLKEATLKALGTGLSMPLDQIPFTFESGDPPQIGLQEAPERREAWHWAVLALTVPYVAALALHGDPGRIMVLRLYQALPTGRVESLAGQVLALAGVRCDGE